MPQMQQCPDRRKWIFLFTVGEVKQSRPWPKKKGVRTFQENCLAISSTLKVSKHSRRAKKKGVHHQ
jgi:hypothetical protein